jgi:GNAT superfamily N-acetyltransferase
MAGMTYELVDLEPGDPRLVDDMLPVLGQLRTHLDAAGLTFAVRKLYVDDLVTTADGRSQGVGHALLAELESRARAAGCTVIDLDSGVQRHDAHRFYFRERMHISSHHFSKALDG